MKHYFYLDIIYDSDRIRNTPHPPIKTYRLYIYSFDDNWKYIQTRFLQAVPGGLFERMRDNMTGWNWSCYSMYVAGYGRFDDDLELNLQLMKLVNMGVEPIPEDTFFEPR